MKNNDEIHLLNKVSNGDIHAFELLFKKYKNITYYFAPTKRDLLMPIPQNELKTRHNWTQNFGY